MQIALLFHKDTLVSSLIQMTGPFVSPVVMRGIGNIKPPHKHAQVAQGSFQEQAEMIVHEDIAVQDNVICLHAIAQ